MMGWIRGPFGKKALPNQHSCCPVDKWRSHAEWNETQVRSQLGLLVGFVRDLILRFEHFTKFSLVNGEKLAIRSPVSPPEQQSSPGVSWRRRKYGGLSLWRSDPAAACLWPINPNFGPRVEVSFSSVSSFAVHLLRFPSTGRKLPSHQPPGLPLYWKWGMTPTTGCVFPMKAE